MKTWTKRLSKFFLILLLLFVCAWWFENWRGARTLEKARARAESAGLSLDIADLQKPPIPDEENLLKNDEFFSEWNDEIEPSLNRWASMKLPGLKDYFRSFIDEKSGQTNDYQEFFEEELTEEEALQKLQEIFQETQERLNRLAEIVLSYPVHDLGSYAVPTTENPIPENQDSAMGILQIQRIAASLHDQAALALRVNKAEIALRNIEVIDHLKATFCQPSFINFLVGNSIVQRTDPLIWEGIRLHAWDSGQLEHLAKHLAKRAPLHEFDQIVQFEAIYSLHSINHLKDILEYHNEGWRGFWGASEELSMKERFRLSLNTSGPAGWTSQRKAIVINQAIDFLEILKEGTLNYIEPKVTVAGEEPAGFSPFEIAKQLSENAPSIASIALKTTTRKRIAQLAIALEQHFLKTGSYPATLGELDHQFDITDVMDPKKRPLAYQPGPDGRPEIWTLKDPKIRWQFSPPSAEQHQPTKPKKTSGS